MARLLFFICLLGTLVNTSAQSDITTVIFVRHAEKVNDGSKDPELHADGRERATKLAMMLGGQPIAAIYSTNYKRTKGTVQPLADAAGVAINVYEPMKADKLQEVINSHREGTIVICGHSNTTPAMINMLTGEETFKQWEDSDYGNLIIVSVPSVGKAKVTRLRY
jgi:2,3-bisphosphoglycerate-dependent phosphoglycerate mutase